MALRVDIARFKSHQSYLADTKLNMETATSPYATHLAWFNEIETFEFSLSGNLGPTTIGQVFSNLPKFDEESFVICGDFSEYHPIIFVATSGNEKWFICGTHDGRLIKSNARSGNWSFTPSEETLEDISPPFSWASHYLYMQGPDKASERFRALIQMYLLKWAVETVYQKKELERPDAKILSEMLNILTGTQEYKQRVEALGEMNGCPNPRDGTFLAEAPVVQLKSAVTSVCAPAQQEEVGAIPEEESFRTYDGTTAFVPTTRDNSSALEVLHCLKQAVGNNFISRLPEVSTMRFEKYPNDEDYFHIRLYAGKYKNKAPGNVAGRQVWAFLRDLDRKQSSPGPRVHATHQNPEGVYAEKDMDLDYPDPWVDMRAERVDSVTPFNYAQTFGALSAIIKYYFLVAAAQQLLGFCDHKIVVCKVFVNELARVCSKMPQRQTAVASSQKHYPLPQNPQD
jgi:hypothetical protein